MVGTILAILAQEAEAEGNDPKHLYPHWEELLIGVLAFSVLFFFVWKWVLPRVNTLLDERREKIQGELEKAEETRHEADAELTRYREQLANARDEANRIIEEARQTAERLRVDLQAKAEEESRATVARAQEEIRAERDRVFQELRVEVGQIAVDLAGRVVGQSLDPAAHERLIDDYIDQVAGSGNGNGNGNGDGGR